MSGRIRDIIRELGAVVLIAVILYFFYRSWWAFILLIPFCIFYHRYYRKELVKKREDLLSLQFRDALISITGALRAGYSFENALTDCCLDMKSLYGEKSPIYTELQRVSNEIRLGVNTERALMSLAERSKVEDIYTFASVFSIAKRGGGDLVEIIKKTSDDITAKIDTRNEIAVLISSRKMEQNIMSFMPLGIILYIGLSSPSMLEPLYGNIIGIIVMTVCLAVYAAAYCLSKRIMNIEV